MLCICRINYGCHLNFSEFDWDYLWHCLRLGITNVAIPVLGRNTIGRKVNYGREIADCSAGLRRWVRRQYPVRMDEQ